MFFHLSHLLISEGLGGCIAQRSHLQFSPSGPGFESRLLRDFYLLLSLWTVDRAHLVLMQEISQIQLAAKARAGVLQKKISEGLEFWNPVKFYNFSASERLIGVDARLTKLIDTRWRRRQVPTSNLNSCPDRIPESGLPPPPPTRPFQDHILNRSKVVAVPNVNS